MQTMPYDFLHTFCYKLALWKYFLFLSEWKSNKLPFPQIDLSSIAPPIAIPAAKKPVISVINLNFWISQRFFILQNGNTFVSIPQTDPQDYLSRNSSSSEAEKRLAAAAAAAQAAGSTLASGSTVSGNGSTIHSGQLFMPNWSEIFPPPPPDQPPPIVPVTSGCGPSPPNTSARNLFNFRQQVKLLLGQKSANFCGKLVKTWGVISEMQFDLLWFYSIAENKTLE